MTAKLQEEVNQIIEYKSRVTRLDNLIQGYRLCSYILTSPSPAFQHPIDRRKANSQSSCVFLRYYEQTILFSVYYSFLLWCVKEITA